MSATVTFRSSGDLAADRRYLWAEASEKAGDLIAAADLYSQATEAAPGWPAAWLALGRTQAAAGNRAGAEAALATALRLDPADVMGARLLLARLRGENCPAMPPGYVAGLFDAYAERFDAHLTGDLGYRAPQVMLAMLARFVSLPFGEVLDLGCGTGLMGEALAGQVEALDGVDLSAQMLRRAGQRGLYRTLLVDDVVTATLGLARERTYDLVLAADVLVYIGDLAPLFAAVRQVLRPGGLFCFTVQAGAPDHGYSLGADLRYHHSADYLRSEADRAGFDVRLLEAVSTRRDAGIDVPGHCVLLATA